MMMLFLMMMMIEDEEKGSNQSELTGSKLESISCLFCPT